MIDLTINDKPVSVPEGASLLEAVEAAGVHVPTLCHAKGVKPMTSCMLCVVEEANSGRTLPACSAKAEAGMAVLTDTDAIHTARREVLQLLLSEHLGDCEAPCRRMCPASLDIPLMLRYIEKGEEETAARIAKRDLVIPAVLGYVCNAPCEKGCRRGQQDVAIAIQQMHRQMAEKALDTPGEPLPCAEESGKRVAVVGSGPAGLAAAWTARHLGHSCEVFDKAAEAGGILLSFVDDKLPRAILEQELETLQNSGILFRTGCEIGKDLSLDAVCSDFDAVVLTTDSLKTDLPNTFIAKEEKMPVRSVANGKRAALQADGMLRGIELPQDDYDSKLGRLKKEELPVYLPHRMDNPDTEDTQHIDVPPEEAARCLHCDCLRPRSCKLRRYATEYQAEPNTFRHAERPPMASIQVHENIYFEAGKCIRCGLCVEITDKAKAEKGMAIVARGFNSQVKVPFGDSLELGLGDAGAECVKACPTGALAFIDQEEREA